MVMGMSPVCRCLVSTSQAENEAATKMLKCSDLRVEGLVLKLFSLCVTVGRHGDVALLCHSKRAPGWGRFLPGALLAGDCLSIACNDPPTVQTHYVRYIGVGVTGDLCQLGGALQFD